MNEEDNNLSPIENPAEAIAPPIDENPTAGHVIAVDLDVDHLGTSIYLKGQSAVDTPHPPLILVHDFSVNSSHYRSACKGLVDRNLSTYAYDIRGHGRSGRIVGHIPSFGSLVKDLLQVAAWVKHREDGRAPIIVGHGLGAMVASAFQYKHSKFCSGLILVAPTFKLKYPVSAFTMFCIGVAADIYPRLKLPRRLIPKYFCPVKNPQKNSTFSSRRVSAQFARELYSALETGPNKFLKISSPTLLLLPEVDTIADTAILVELLERHKDRHLIEIIRMPAASHNLLTDDESNIEANLDVIETWVKNTSKATLES